MDRSYTVFVDESFFDGFTNLSKEDSYFCYAALMVPTSSLPDLERFWNANRDRLVADYKKATGFEITGEFKSGYLKKLPVQTRGRFAERLGNFLSKNDGYVAAFYTTVGNLLAYDLRTKTAMDESATHLPPDWSTQIPVVKEKLLSHKPNQPGDSYLLLSLFHQTLSITHNWLGSGGYQFKLVYDPRQKKEDSFLLRHLEDLLAREGSYKNMSGTYVGGSASVVSSASPGLMLVDLILRDVRFLFSDIPELLHEQSAPSLILPIPQGFEPIVRPFGGAPLKWGDRHPMSAKLQSQLAHPTENSMLALYAHRLADGKVSCHAAYGESRAVNFGLRCFEDMVD